MDYVQGEDLETLWMTGALSPEEKKSILTDIAAILAQLRELTPPKDGVVSSANAGGILDYRIGCEVVGPFQSHSDFHSFLRGNVSLEETSSAFGEEVASSHSKDYRTFFTHADLSPRNIIIRDGRIVAIVDWALAGWYPEYWEITKTYYTSFKVPEWSEEISRLFPLYKTELVAERCLWQYFDQPANFL